MPKCPLFTLCAALVIVLAFSLNAMAEDQSPNDLSADVTVKTPDITVHAPSVAAGVKARTTSQSSSYTEKHTDLPNGSSTVIQKENHSVGAVSPVGAIGTTNDADMTVDDDE